MNTTDRDHDSIDVSEHAKLRWLERHSDWREPVGLRLRELWQDGSPVDSEQIEGHARRVRDELLLVADRSEECIRTVLIDRGGTA